MHSTCPLQYILEWRLQRHAGSKCSHSLISVISVGARPASGFSIFWLRYQSLLFRTCHVVKAADFLSNYYAGTPQLLEISCDERKTRGDEAAWYSLCQLCWMQWGGTERWVFGEGAGGCGLRAALQPCAPRSPLHTRPWRETCGLRGDRASSPRQRRWVPTGCDPGFSKGSNLSCCWPGERGWLWEGKEWGERGGKKLQTKAKLWKQRLPREVFEMTWASLLKLISACPLAFLIFSSSLRPVLHMWITEPVPFKWEK